VPISTTDDEVTVPVEAQAILEGKRTGSFAHGRLMHSAATCLVSSAWMKGRPPVA
jgi:hypothetical protein